MLRALAVVSIAAAVAAPGARAGPRIVDSLDLSVLARRGAVGLSVPGAGPEVTRASALNTLLTGEVRSSVLGGTRPGTPRVDLGSPAGNDVLVVLPPPGSSENDRYPIAVVGGGATGLLTSPSTRIAGLVSLADVARGRLRWVADDDPVRTLATLERRIERNDRLRAPLTLALAVAALAVSLVRPRFAPRVFLLALAGNLWLAGWWWAALVGVAAAALPLGWAAAAVLAAVALTLWRDPAAIALSPFGPSQAGRFFGVSNLLETMLLVPALLGGALLGRLGIAVGALAVVTVAGSGLGADGGGLLVLLAAYAALALRRHASRPRLVHAAAAAVAVVALAGLLVGLDAAVGASSHVTEAVAAGPHQLLSDLATRLELSVRRTTASAGALVVVALSLAALVVVATRRPRTVLVDALLVGVAVSLLVNDTPSDVAAVAAVAAVVLRRFETVGPAGRAGTWLDSATMRKAVFVLGLLLVSLALVAAGCGGEEVTATPETVVGEVPTTAETNGAADLPALALEGDATAGAEIFASSGCGGCHTLAAAGSSGNVGPNLDEAKPSYELAVTRITKGQGGMPSFDGQLEPQQIADVAQYVVDSTSG